MMDRCHESIGCGNLSARARQAHQGQAWTPYADTNGAERGEEEGQVLAQAKLKVELINFPSASLSTVCAAAKRCYSSAETEHLLDGFTTGIDEADREKLGEYVSKVMERGHLSVIEHASYSFAVEGISRAMEEQLVRHRLASYSILSQRCVKFEDGFDYIVPPSIAENKKLLAEYRSDMLLRAERYKRLLDAGIPAEDARYILPLATESKLILTMNARQLLHFFSLRCCTRAQWEIRMLADAMLEILQSTDPELFRNAGASCEQTGICPEGERGCGKHKGLKGDT